jgi:UDP-N-acetylmuramyl pentapeptide phosphotransferase/UDP-N-acetylglucosamine-1-phosphate transferase
MGNLLVTDFHGFFGLKPDYFSSMVLTVLGMVFIINGFNLIDGIDGLAAITGIISTIAFSTWFFINGNLHIPILGAALIGGLFAFSYYNVFSKRQKIFMGDTGSLLLGFLLSVIAVHFSEFTRLSNSTHHTYTMNSGPGVAMAILIVPIIDTTRVFFLRISQGKSPFTADKNHIHHRMLALGFSHLQVSLIIGAINIAFVILGFYFRNLGMLRLIGLVIGLGLFVAYIPSLVLYRKRRHAIRRWRAIKKQR